MGVRILVGNEQGDGDEIACFFCSVSGKAFGPVFRDGEEQAEAFKEWLENDPRKFSDAELMSLYAEFLTDRAKAF